MSDFRDDESLRHSMSRGGNARLHHHNHTTAPNITLKIVYDGQGTGDSVTTDRFMHVGCSPVISSFDRSQARKRFQTYMGDN